MPRLLRVLLQPRKCFALIASDPQWLRQFVFLAAVSILLAVVIHPRITQLTIDHLPTMASSEEKEAMRSMFNEQLPVKCAFLPFRLLIGWVSFTLVLFFTARSLTTHHTARFGQLLSLEVHAEMILLVGQIISFPGGIIQISENPSWNPLGLDLLFPGIVNAASREILNSLNPFTVWYLIFLVGGIIVLYDCKVWKSVVAVVGSWSLTLVFSLGVFKLLMDTYHFRL